MNWFHIASQSLLNRKTTALLTLFMLAISISLILTVDRIRVDTKENFSNTLSGTDLILGARTGSLNLLLYSVFRIGNASNNIGWASYLELTENEAVAWAVPISLGDSHKGYKVVGTTTDYFKYYQFSRGQSLEIYQGKAFENVFDVVLGYQVAKKLGYQLGEQLVLSHGIGNTSFKEHDDKPFSVVGILKPTGTPVDQSLHISLEGMSAIHINWRNGFEIPGMNITAEQALQMDLTPKTITAALIGMKSRIQTFQFQRMVNDYRNEPLMAIIPGATLAELWQMMSIAEQSLLAISAMVIVTGLLGMMTVILAGLNERRREMAILRALGCPASNIVLLLVLEAGFYGLSGLLLGYGLHLFWVAIASNLMMSLYGIELSMNLPNLTMLWVMTGFLVSSFLIGIVPGIKAYRQSLTDGLTLRT